MGVSTLIGGYDRERTVIPLDVSQFEISVIILTYNSSLVKTLLTINSILLQRDIRQQIVIADDGSSVTNKEKVDEFFIRNGFKDYIFYHRAQNGGMVANTRDALYRCEGKYIKMLSPGDYLHGFYALRNWLDYMKEQKLKVSYSDAIYYQYKNNMITPACVKIDPQYKEGGLSGRIHQLAYDDTWLGASVIAEAELMRKYIEKIYPKVIYLEDQVYRFMTYSGETYQRFCGHSVLYEWGTGISTSQNSEWTKLLQKDWDVATELIETIECDSIRLKKLVRRSIKRKKISSKLFRILYTLIYMPGYYPFDIQRRLWPRRSSDNLDMDFINKLIKYEEHDP